LGCESIVTGGMEVVDEEVFDKGYVLVGVGWFFGWEACEECVYFGGCDGFVGT